MRSIDIFTSAFFYCAATAVALQPGKVELHGVPRNAVASIRGGNKKVSVQRERSLQGLKDSGITNRRLDDISCNKEADDSLICLWEDYPGVGFNTVLSCPAAATTTNDCSTCAIATDDSEYQCSSCTICSHDDVVRVAYDCSNIAKGDCVFQDCDGNCEDSAPAPTDCGANACSGDDDCCDGYICTYYDGFSDPICIVKHPAGEGCGEALCMEDADCCEGYICSYYEGISVPFCIKKWW